MKEGEGRVESEEDMPVSIFLRSKCRLALPPARRGDDIHAAKQFRSEHDGPLAAEVDEEAAFTHSVLFFLFFNSFIQQMLGPTSCQLLKLFC